MAKTILVVDDSASVRLVVRMSLEGAGYAVLDASDGPQALAVLDGRSISLILSDLNMPGMSGIELVRQVKALSPYKFTPILMLTTECSDAKKADGKAAGLKAWMVKPFSPTQLLKAVSQLTS